MPLSLVAPRAGQSPNWRIRGTYKGVSINKSAGTPTKANAASELKKTRDDIDAGRFIVEGELTFAEAVERYIDHTGQERFLARLVEHFGDRPIRMVDSRAIDGAASALYPKGSAATRNRQVYTPVSAILRHVGHSIVVKRPQGGAGGHRIAYLEPEAAFALLRAGKQRNARFGALLMFLLYTGARLSEGLRLIWEDVSLDAGTVLIRQTKTERARTAIMPPELVQALRELPAAKVVKRKRPAQFPTLVFRLHKTARLYTWLEASAAVAGVRIPDRVAFHILRHTWATWMRRYAGTDTAGLVETGAWATRAQASRYEHLDASEEAARALKLPMMERC